MSFIRPEAKDQIRRFGEPLIYLVVATWGLWTGFSAVGGGSWTGLIPLVLGLIAALALFNAVERAIVSWRTRVRGPGVVQVHEGRIAYFGPEGGAVTALDGLASVSIVTTADGPLGADLYWHLSDVEGQVMVIPGGAEGTQALLDRLGSLSGFDHMAVIQAMGSTDSAQFPLWHRDGAPRRPGAGPAGITDQGRSPH